MSLGSTLFGAALGYGIGGNERSAIGGAAIGYALNKFSHHQPLLGGACGKDKVFSPVSGRCITMGGSRHAGLKAGYTESQNNAMKKAIQLAKQRGYGDYSAQMRSMVSKAIREN